MPELYPPTRNQHITKLMVIGDSHAAGEGATSRDIGWFGLTVAQLYDKYDTYDYEQGQAHAVDHMDLASTGGLMSAYARDIDALARLFHRAPRGGRALWMVQLGGNDAYIDNWHGRTRTPAEEYAASVRCITRAILQARGSF